MTLRHLTVFLCVCDAGNMTVAAEKLHVAQPSVSQTIAELENHYSIKLFERLGKKLFITAAGRKLITYARHIVNLSKEAEDAMRDIGSNAVIRLGASVTVGTCILNDIISEFSGYNPHVRIIATVNNTKVIEEMILLDQLDIGLVEGKIHSQAIMCKPFMDDELVLVCSYSNQLAKSGKIKPAAIHAASFIIREEGSGTRELFEEVMAKHGVPWKIYGVYNNAEAIKNAVAAGHALSVMSRLTVDQEVNRHELAVVDIAGLDFKRQFTIIHHKNKFISSALDNFIKLCMELSFNHKRKI
ncbi:LysR family transcriptional regulator [Sporomusa aerivorans]|uniref:LysR family transcriptional regulator n=1 Tax=Sporomusa aerivorans TaxID=204936 RepID=UPI00352B3CF9